MISVTQGLHCDFACLMFTYTSKVSHPRKGSKKSSRAVVIEQEFLTEALPVKLIGMNHILMSSSILNYIILTPGCSQML